MRALLGDMESCKGAIELHMENLMKGHQNLWMGYKSRLLQVRALLKELEQQSNLSVIEGDSFVRFKANNDTSFNSLFFVYEIGSVFPTLKWRHLIGTDQGFNYFLLTKPISCLPAFSFSLAQHITLIYWGEHIPFLSAIVLRDLKLRNFVLKVNIPSLVEVSAANIVWPKSAYPLMDQEFGRLAAYYIFNSLMPPILDGADNIWSESPLVIVGDRTVRFLTIHKTLCTIDEKSIRTLKERGVVNARATVIDRSFNERRIPIDVPEECFNKLVMGEPPYEVVFVKDIRIRYDPAVSEQKSHIRYTVYPFESIKLFDEKSYGLPLSIVSIVLRELYLRSNDPFYFTVTPEEFKKFLVKILSPFSHDHINKLGLKLIESRNGIHTLASLLGVYSSDGSLLSYLHPALLECLIGLERRVEKKYLISLQRIASKYAQEAESLGSLQSVLLIQELFEKEFCSKPSHSIAKRLMASLYSIVKVCIPLSKGLGSLSRDRAS